jgi:diaminobutyrate-2-oxoglutarate transaminase
MSKRDIFERNESQVRSYCRRFPTVFTHAQGCWLHDERGQAYVDFFVGAGALNYGHNPPALKREVIAYLERDGVIHALDMHTEAKADFLEAFERVILKPRQMHYRIQFTGPTGTNAVEAALKIARKATGREGVIAFTNAFHGMSLGAMSVSATENRRQAAGVPLQFVTRMPYDGYFGPDIDTIDFLERQLSDPTSGIEIPAAIILETIQAEGGIRVAQVSWLQRLEALARKHGILLIVDDIQAGCGRTGDFFSFERAGLSPDIICLSKSIGGYGLPMSLVLLRQEIDIWKPGEHNGTFRGNNLAFVAARAALHFWEDPAFIAQVREKGAYLHRRLRELALASGLGKHDLRGIGFMQGLSWEDPSIASDVSARAYAHGLIAEVCGPRDEVLKVIPPLTISIEDMEEGLSRLARAMADVAEARASRAPARAVNAAIPA